MYGTVLFALFLLRLLK